jgi:hypothetical protein
MNAAETEKMNAGKSDVNPGKKRLGYKDGKPRSTVGGRPRKEPGRVLDAQEAVSVRGCARQHRGSEQLSPVRGEDGHWHQQDAQSPIGTRLLHRGPHHGGMGEGEHHPAVSGGMGEGEHTPAVNSMD